MSDTNRTAHVLLAAAREAGIWVSADLRIGLGDAAELIGWTQGAMRNAIAEGCGPPVFRLGGRGHRVTVRLTDLAAWIEARRE